MTLIRRRKRESEVQQRRGWGLYNWAKRQGGAARVEGDEMSPLYRNRCLRAAGLVQPSSHVYHSQLRYA